jgi:protein subunit release factor B
LIKFGVKPEKVAALEQRLEALGIREEDLEESFVRGGGPGGQKVNKTSSAVVLRHVPTGIEVRAHSERSQALNRFFARRLLADRLEAQQRGGLTEAEEQRIAKLRRQKQRRRRRSRKKATTVADSRPAGEDPKEDLE